VKNFIIYSAPSFIYKDPLFINYL